MTPAEEITGFPRPVTRTSAGGVPVFSSEADGPVSATLAFRVGRIDERLTTSGITHLVEHLAMPAYAGHAFELNASVASIRTIFWAHGEQAEVAEFLAGVCSALRALPVDRLEAERRILKSESEQVGSTAYAVLAGTRFGARGIGLVNWGETGLDRFSPEDLVAWAALAFTAANASAWTTGDGDALRLDLPEGERVLPPPLEQNAFTSPAFVKWGSGGIAFSATTRRSMAARTAAELLRERLLHVLRYELGISYSVSLSYEPLSAHVAQIFVVADSLAGAEDRVLAGTLEALQTFARDGPSDEELERQRAIIRRHLADPDQARAWLDSLVDTELLGAPLEPSDELVAQSDALTGTDIAAAAHELLDDVLFCIPDALAAPEELHEFPGWDEAAVTGRRFRPRRQGWRRPKSAAVVGAEGVSLRDSEGTGTIRVEDAVGVFRWPDRRRMIVRADGRHLTLSDGVYWRRGGDLLRLIDATYPSELHIDVNEILPAAPRRRVPFWLLVVLAFVAALITGASVKAITGEPLAGNVTFWVLLAGLVSAARVLRRG